MVIDWSVTALYNTIMSIATGVSLLLIVRFFSHLAKEKVGQLEGWALGFAIPGFILTLTGAHMSLTAPLSKVGFPFDDIIFGESSFRLWCFTYCNIHSIMEKIQCIYKTRFKSKRS